jgi:hypothetical protein
MASQSRANIVFLTAICCSCILVNLVDGFTVTSQPLRVQQNALHRNFITHVKRAPLGKYAATKTKISCGLDFDSVRASLRTVIQVIALSGSAVAIGTLTVVGVKAGAKNEIFNLKNLKLWAATMTAEEWAKLCLCLTLDLGGAAPEVLFPGIIGETLDVIWAPLYAFALFREFICVTHQEQIGTCQPAKCQDVSFAALLP